MIEDHVRSGARGYIALTRGAKLRRNVRSIAKYCPTRFPSLEVKFNTGGLGLASEFETVLDLPGVCVDNDELY